MAARTPRRTFASPFVVTLAAAVPVAACYVQPARPGPAAGGEPRGGDPAQPQEAPPAPPPTVVANPPRPTPPEPAPPPPAPAPTASQNWTIRMDRGQCRAFVEVSCPPKVMCNPPPPKAYACPPGMTNGESRTLVQNASTCTLIPKMPTCPPNTMCNPPPPQKVACP